MSNRQRSALRRTAINTLLAGGRPPETIIAAFEAEPLAELVAGACNPSRSIIREIKMVLAQREADPQQTATRDHLADFRRMNTLAEEGLADATGPDRRLVLDQIDRFRRDLQEAEGRGLMPPPRQKPGPKPRSPEEGRPVGQKRHEAGRVSGTPPIDWSTREGKYLQDAVKRAGGVQCPRVTLKRGTRCTGTVTA